MTTTFVDKGSYFLVENSEGMKIGQIIAALQLIFSREDLLTQHHLWLFSGEEMELSLEGLEKIRDYILQQFPGFPGETRHLAIVAASGFQKSIAELFQRMSGELPFQVAVFDNIEDAERWFEQL